MAMGRDFATADLCDGAEESGALLFAASPIFRSFGGSTHFSGAIETVSCRDDNSLVRTALEEAGKGRVLVVDNGGSKRCAVLGGNLAQLGADNGWSGVVVNGCVRDVLELSRARFGVLALASHPRRSVKRGQGERGKQVNFAGVDFIPGQIACADPDGLVVGEAEAVGVVGAVGAVGVL